MEIIINIPAKNEQDLLDTFANYSDYNNENKIEWMKKKIINFIKAEIISFKTPELKREAIKDIDKNFKKEIEGIEYE